MVTGTPALNMGYSVPSLLSHKHLGSLVLEAPYLSHMSAAFFNSTDSEMATTVQLEYANHPKLFAPYCHRVDLLFRRSDCEGLLAVPKICR